VRALAGKPRLLVVEDVFSAMEPRDRRLIASCLTAPDRPWTLVTVSNDPLLASHCDRVVILKEGLVETEGTFQEIQNSAHFKPVFRQEDSRNLSGR